MSASRVCALFSDVCAVSVGPAVLWSGWSLWPSTSATPTGAEYTSAAVIFSMIRVVSELKDLDLGEEILHL